MRTVKRKGGVGTHLEAFPSDGGEGIDHALDVVQLAHQIRGFGLYPRRRRAHALSLSLSPFLFPAKYVIGESPQTTVLVLFSIRKEYIGKCLGNASVQTDAT